MTDIQRIADDYLDGKICLEEAVSKLNVSEGVGDVIGKGIEQVGYNALHSLRSAAVMTAAGSLMALAGAIISKLSSPKATKKQNDILTAAIPSIVKDVLEELRPEVSGILYGNAIGQATDVSAIIEKASPKIDRVIDQHLPHVFRAISMEVRDNVKKSVEWELNNKLDKFTKDLLGAAQQGT